MRFDKWTMVIIFGIIAFVSLFLSFDGDYVTGPFILIAIIFSILTLIAFFYPNKK